MEGQAMISREEAIEKIKFIEDIKDIQSLIDRIYNSRGTCGECKWCHITKHNWKDPRGHMHSYTDYNCEVRGLDNIDCSRVEETDFCNEFERKENEIK
jgi:hypothetical protein